MHCSIFFGNSGMRPAKKVLISSYKMAEEIMFIQTTKIKGGMHESDKVLLKFKGAKLTLLAGGKEGCTENVVSELGFKTGSIRIFIALSPLIYAFSTSYRHNKLFEDTYYLPFSYLLFQSSLNSKGI